MEMNCFIVDTFAWIEYLEGSEQGLRFLELIKNNQNDFLTPLVVLTELKDYCMFTGKDFEEVYRTVRENSRVLELNEDDAINAGKNHFIIKKKIKNFGYMDAFIIAAYHKIKKINKNTRILTGDKHFKGFEFTEFIGKR